MSTATLFVGILGIKGIFFVHILDVTHHSCVARGLKFTVPSVPFDLFITMIKFSLGIYC